MVTAREGGGAVSTSLRTGNKRWLPCPVGTAEDPCRHDARGVPTRGIRRGDRMGSCRLAAPPPASRQPGRCPSSGRSRGREWRKAAALRTG